MDSNIYNTIKTVFNHIKLYIESLIRPFQDLLKSHNIKLYIKQCLFLYSHPKFGIEIKS